MPLLLQGAALGFSAAAQPGPFQAYLLAQSARNGAPRTFPVALVPLVSDPPVIAVVLAALAQVPGGLLRWIGIVGGAFVLWLGVGALRASRAAASRAPARPPPVGFLRAIVVNLANPNAWLFWSLVGGPILTAAWRESPLASVAFLAGFYGLLVGGNLVIIAAAGALARGGDRAARVLGTASGLALVAFGAWRIAASILGG